MNSLFGVEDLSIHRNAIRILERINWKVNRGEHWVILGANGSGKTSLLKALTGYMTPTAGRIVVLGEQYGASDWRELRKRIGVVSASIAQLEHDEDSALEIVAGGRQAMIGYWGKISPSERRHAGSLLSMMRMNRAAERTWGVLSQGERQRVLIARALMAAPIILILDEPCAGLDPVARERFLSDISKLARKRRAPALVLVTHHVSEIIPEIERVVMLRQGRVFDDGPKEEVLTSERLSALFGVAAEVHRQGARYRLTTH